MPGFTTTTGSRTGAEPASGWRGSDGVEVSRVAAQVHHRALELARVIWAEQRWKSGVATKVVAYLKVLAAGAGQTPPKGIPDSILAQVHRCFAQACLELDAFGLPGQQRAWYDEAVAIAKKYMQAKP